MKYKEQFKNYGLGLGLRKNLRQDTLDFVKSNNLIEWLEIVPENYIYLGGTKKKQFQEFIGTGIPIIPHGVNLSVATAPEKKGQPCFDEFLLKGLEELFALINPPWFSDHISCTRINGFYLQDLIPVPLNKAMIQIISDNLKYLEDRFQLPFLIENPSYYSTILEPELSEVDFVNTLLEKANCGMLLDVNNIYVNSTNHQAYSPEQYLSALNLDRVVQVHIAGHHEDYKAWLSGKKLKVLDTHGAEIKTEVYEILESLLKKTEIKAILLERDSNLPEFSELVGELKHISGIMDDCHCDEERSDDEAIHAKDKNKDNAWIAAAAKQPRNDSSGNDSYELQQEILNYFTAKPCTLSQKTQDELSIYKSLILSSLEGLITKVLPFSYKIMQNNWRKIIQLYYEIFPSNSPIYTQAAKNFPQFLKSSGFKDKFEYPNYISDLALYEWTSIESFNAPDDFRSKAINLKYPISQLIEYLKITEDDISEIRETDIEKQDEFLLSFRDPKTGNSKYLALDPSSYFVFKALENSNDLEKIYIDFKQKFNKSLKNKNERELRKAFDNLVNALSFDRITC